MQILKHFNNDIDTINKVINNIPEIGALSKYLMYIDSSSKELSDIESEYLKTLKDREPDFLTKLLRDYYTKLPHEELINLIISAEEDGWGGFFESDNEYQVYHLESMHTATELQKYVTEEMKAALNSLVDKHTKSAIELAKKEKESKIIRLTHTINIKKTEILQYQEELDKLLKE